ncbi:MAG TPA: PHP domain-containing protein, partial [Caldimonas sp.]|nr:PHP domain-containing protein [Caldimonas sp.]
VAAIRGDAAEAAMLEQGAALLRQRGIASDLDLGPLLDDTTPFPGDPLLRRRLQHMYDAGAWVLMESSLADLPADLRWLFESGAVTLPELAAIHRATGATSASDIATAIEAGTLRALAGLDASKEKAIVATLPSLRASIPRVPLGRAISIVDPIVEKLLATPGIEWATAAGSLRRGQETVGDLEIVASATDPAPAIEDLSHHLDAGRVLHRSARSIYLLFDRVQLGVRLPAPDVAGSTLWRLTGSPAHVAAIAQLARDRGIDLSHAATEEELFARVGLPFIPAEIRDGTDEIAAARERRLPTLVSRSDIRGDLHMHTSWSDGRDSVEAMVAACHALGYEYIAITDHSPRSAASRTLTPDGVSDQADEIAELREKFPGLT